MGALHLLTVLTMPIDKTTPYVVRAPPLAVLKYAIAVLECFARIRRLSTPNGEASHATLALSLISMALSAVLGGGRHEANGIGEQQIERLLQRAATALRHMAARDIVTP